MSSNQAPYVFNPSCNSPLLPSFPFRPWYGEEPVSASDSNHEETPNPFLCAPRTTSHSSTRTLGMVLAKRDGRRPSYSRHPTITLHPDWPVHKLTHEYKRTFPRTRPTVHTQQHLQQPLQQAASQQQITPASPSRFLTRRYSRLKPSPARALLLPHALGDSARPAKSSATAPRPSRFASALVPTPHMVISSSWAQ